MARIFLALATFAVALLVLNMVLGFFGGDYNGRWRALFDAARAAEQLERQGTSDAAARSAARQEVSELSRQFLPIRQWTTVHRLVGVAAALVTVLVNSITVTYFIGTARWCREVADTYRLDPNLPAQSERWKRRSFPWSVAGILTIIGLVTLGALADPGANFEHSTDWVLPHWTAAVMGTILIAYAFVRQLGNIAANYEVIEQILAQVRQIRTDRGLEPGQPVELAEETPRPAR